MLSMIISELKHNRQWGTAHVYASAYKAFVAFRKGVDINFQDFSAEIVKDFEIYIRNKQCSWNTVATYIKVLKATYNRAIECGAAIYKPRLFANVHTTTDNRRKRALNADEIGALIADDKETKSKTDFHVRHIFKLMFLLRGIPFVDLAYLRKSDVCDGYIMYHRRKTKRAMTVKLTAEATMLVNELSASTPLNSPYLFPFILSPEGSEAAYKEYQCALRQINHKLQSLSQDMPTHLSTYTARHTWATMAYYCEIHQGIISEAMGHSSISVTETYLKPFQNERIDRANDKVIEYVKRKSRKL